MKPDGIRCNQHKGKPKGIDVINTKVKSERTDDIYRKVKSEGIYVINIKVKSAGTDDISINVKSE